jgi:hypothetical protein
VLRKEDAVNAIADRTAVPKENDLLVPATPFFMPESGFVRILQPGTDAEILLSDVWETAWRYLVESRQATLDELARHLGRPSDDPALGRVVRDFIAWDLVWVVPPGGWEDEDH